MINRLMDFIHDHPRLLVLTGAGCSVNSGIPAYRDGRGNWQRSDPIKHQEFISCLASRKRYWARSYVGWPPVKNALPNAAHRSLANLESLGRIDLLVTQNVDRLHQRAGQRHVIDLHGRLDQVVCLECRHVSHRDEVQQQLEALNPHLGATEPAASLAPDGDADVADSLVEKLSVPLCRYCGGLLKPNVVFFGDSVDRSLVEFIFERLENSDGLMVVGSSLMVFSGYRFCRHAARHNKPIACINAGQTRADDLFTLKLEQDCGEVLQALSQALSGRGAAIVDPDQ
ncbi:MAG: NAD-dependent protein deacetylase [Gammaproteobacteria bacterium]